MSMHERDIDESTLSAIRRRYEGLSDEALADIASRDPEDLSLEARAALEAELKERDKALVERQAEAIRDQRKAAIDRANAAIPEHRWDTRGKATPAYEQTIRIARWLAFVPAAWQAAHVHGWILHFFGVEKVGDVMALNDGDLLAFGVAGFLTPLVAVSVGAWVCPAKRKSLPVFVLSALCIVGAAYSLHMLSRSGAPDALRHLFGLGAIVTMAVSVMAAGVFWLAPWRKKPLTRVTPLHEGD
jgi:ElaB/YqjD/DUF883 family membrane-anchored ribosome-binding protein